MRGAFVLQLGTETKPSDDDFEGWVEEVDSGKELRFHSTGELIQFLGECFRTAFPSRQEKPGQCAAPGSCQEEEA
jgi:hypothetical protein